MKVNSILKWLFYNRNSANTQPSNLECIGDGYYLPENGEDYTYVEYKRDDWGNWYKTDNYITQDTPATCQVVGII